MSVVAPRHSTASMANAPRNSIQFQNALKPKLSRQLLQPHVTLVEHKTARFLITDQPNQATMQNFIITCRVNQVRLLVRVSEPTYDQTALEEAGIRVVELKFEDGAPPPESVLDNWFQLINEVWQSHPGSCIAVHCRAGLGRAPALVAVALIELGLSYDEAIEMIRCRRAGALNVRQIQYLKDFRPRKRLRLKTHTEKCVVL